MYMLSEHLVNHGTLNMSIIIEGMDNSGKSTLGEFLVDKFKHLYLQESEGPPVNKEEMMLRIDRYQRMHDTLFVRHPLVSNPVYDSTRTPERRIEFSPNMLNTFYRHGHIFIYCDPLDRDLVGHQLKPHDTEEHMREVMKNKAYLLQLYREWAVKRAHIMYRIGDDMEKVCLMIRGLLKP